MKYKSSRYDIQVINSSDQLDLDFILPKDDERMIHGKVWDDSDIPARVPGAIVMVYIPGPTYYENDPNDLKPVGCITADQNGEFVAGPFKVQTTAILKFFKPDKSEKGFFMEEFEEAQYVYDENEQ